VIFSFYLRNTVTQYYYSIGSYFFQEQAESIAGNMESPDAPLSSTDSLFNPTIDGYLVFVLNRDGEYIRHFEKARIGSKVSSDYGDDFSRVLLSTTPGAGRLEDEMLVYGFAPVKSQDVIVVVIGNISENFPPVKEFQQITALQILIILMVTTVIAGWIIRRMVGRPLSTLITAAQQIGEGNLEVDVKPGEMKDELKLLAIAINAVRDQLSRSVQGLKTRIQELALAQELIKNREDQTRAIIDSVNEAIIVLDLYTGDVLDMNLKMTEMYGYTREEVLKLRINQLNLGELPYTHKFFKKYMKDAAHSGPQMFEWKARHKDGRQFWVEINMRKAVISGNDRLLVAVREIAERKRAEQIRTAIYRISHSVHAAQNLKELFYLIHGIINDLMPAQNFYIALYDHERDEFYYPYYVDQYDTTPAPHAPNRGLTSYVLRSGASLLATPEVFGRLMQSGEVEMIGSNSMDWLGSPLNIAQKVIGVVAVQTYSQKDRLTEEDKDVLAFVSTQIAMAIERKRSEDALLESETRWRTLTENAPQVILLLDKFGTVLFGNRLPPGMDSRGPGLDSFLNFMQDDNRLIIENALNVVFDESRGTNFEVSIRSADGNVIWYACNLSPVVTDERVEMAILNANDITSRKDAENSIQILNEELEKRVLERTAQLASAVRELEAFSYSVSHDLRAPLRALDGYSRILEREYAQVMDDDGKAYINHILSSTHKMDRLINDLLAFSRLGRHSLEKRTVDMNDIVQKAIDEFSPIISIGKLPIKVFKLPACEGDPALLLQLWMNLLSNSIKFTKNCDRPKIEIGYLDEESIVYFIKDNGIGFDMKYADKLFGVFQRLHKMDEFEGTGVGLAIVERIVRSHGGRIWAKSAPGEGTTFFFTLTEKSNPDLVTLTGE
jgi:PAS domain S-box-containing protein